MMELSAREIGRIVGTDAGPTLVVVAGMHGNEPSGILGARRVLAALDGKLPCGELIVLAGNIGALRRGVRYLKKDLNRQWSAPHVAAIVAGENLDEEDTEARELLAAIEAAQARARGHMFLADFHTSSARGIPFVMIGDTPDQRAFVGALPIPVILGLEAQLNGVLSLYFTNRGYTTFAVEGGGHTDPASVDALEAVLWTALAQAGMVDDRAELANAQTLLERLRDGLPRMLEIVSRHAITVEDAFVMEPGFRNIDYAKEGQLLARDARGEIRAPVDGVVIMPLYQGLGSDGYFWGRPLADLVSKSF